MINNNFDLFHPETFIYNKQFPNDWNFPHTTTITSVDLPLMEFLVAILMKITGVTSPWIFRSCTLLIAVIGMFYLYKLAFLLTNDWIKSLLVTAVAMTSPVYAYYFNGFIQSTKKRRCSIQPKSFKGTWSIDVFLRIISYCLESILLWPQYNDNSI